MENKFYTPKIDEFFVGFEYEHYLTPSEYIDGTGWLRCIFPNDPFVGSGILRMKSFENIRVKYLDKEDIESFGFKLKVENKYGITFANELYSIVYSKLKNNHVEVFLIQPYINESDGLKFSGIIKNKSELKKLLIQLEIINE